MGVDVGGTFTKAVAINSELRLVGKAAVPTTYDPPDGVSAGIISSLQKLLNETGIEPNEIELVAFSTTHAVNALLEGDVAPVGIVAMGRESEKSRIVKRTRLDDMELNQGKILRTFYAFIPTDNGLEENEVREKIMEMVELGAKAIVATEAYGVDKRENEKKVKEVAESLGVPCVTGSDVSGAYGLEIRTITAVINAAILPKMIDVAEKLKKSVRELGINAPIMVMKCDGGLSSIDILKTKPLFTILSGPAASVVGTLAYTKAVDAIIIEVGGTTTNISVVRNGKLEMKYIDVLGYPTTIRSVDVRILPVGGGDLVKIKARKIVDIGPRSARSAGLPYCCFESPEKLKGGKAVLTSPRGEDLEEYAVLRTVDGDYAITLTCVSNYLGAVPDGDYAEGDKESAKLAVSALSSLLSKGEERVCEEVMSKASRKIEDVIKSLIKEYKLNKDKLKLIGVGGGAGVIIPYVAKRMGLKFEIPENAEVISSAGTAMAMMREEVERNVDGYDEKIIVELMEEARNAIIEKGAVPDSVNVEAEYIPERGVVRVVAIGTTGSSPSKVLDEGELKEIAEEILGNGAEILASTRYYYIFRKLVKEGFGPLKRRRSKVIVVDRFGRVHVSLRDGVVITGDREEVFEGVRDFITSGNFRAEIGQEVYVITDSRVFDLSMFSDARNMLSAFQKAVEKSVTSKFVVVIGR